MISADLPEEPVARTEAREARRASSGERKERR
jgi:hypothetical protein